MTPTEPTQETGAPKDFVAWRDEIFMETGVDRKDGKWVVDELAALILIGRLYAKVAALESELAQAQVEQEPK